MHTTNLRKVGGSVMLAVPPALLELLRLRPGAQVAIGIEGERLVVEPRQRHRYTLDELIAQCNPRAARSQDEREWLSEGPVGGEVL
jgi:antitoxin ChpS